MSSRKALFTLIALVAALVMVFTNHITGHDALDFMKWVLGAWIFAQTAEDVTMHIKGVHPGTVPNAAPKVYPPGASLPPGASYPPGSSTAPQAPAVPSDMTSHID